jgi:hypothetical protein
LQSRYRIHGTDLRLLHKRRWTLSDVDTATVGAKSNLVDACQTLVPGFDNQCGGKIEALLLGRLTLRIKGAYAG